MVQYDAIVTGLTCQHCVQTVTTEVGALEGVSDLSIDLVPNGESVLHFDAVEEDALVQRLATALAGAGYSLQSLQRRDRG